MAAPVPNNEVLLAWNLKQEFELLEDEKISQKFSFEPSLLTIKQDSLRAFYLRTGNSIPSFYLQRLSLMKTISGFVTEIFVVFEKTPPNAVIVECSRYGIGAIVSMGKSCKLVHPSQKWGSAIKINAIVKVPKMSQIDLFISSKQVLEERDIAKDIIDLVRNSMKKPVYAKLVEEDQRYNEMSNKKLKELIELCLQEADYTICFLGDERRDIVAWEVKRALEILYVEQVIIFLKSSREAKHNWSGLIEFIHTQYELKGKTVKYIEYVDTRDFRNKFHERIMVLLEKIHQKMGVPLITT